VSNQNNLVPVDQAKTITKEYKMLNDEIDRQKKLLELAQIITSEINLEALFELIILKTNAFMNTEQCSVFLFDSTSEELWALVSTDQKKNEIRIHANQGIAGWVFQNKTSVMTNDAYNDWRFLSEIDRKTGFRTVNILCVPLINREKKCIGTLQTLNKKTGDFTEQDEGVLVSASYYVAIALENAKLYEELKRLDSAKERVINHLSHELKTPLAIISAVFKKVQEKLDLADTDELDKTLSRGKRNLRKLQDLQEKIEDILDQRPVVEKDKMLDTIETAAFLVWDLCEERKRPYAEIIAHISERLESLLATDETVMEEVNVGRFLNDLCDGVLGSMGKRDLNLIRDIDDGIQLIVDRNVLEKVCLGLLKNAIENTPDEGKMVLTAKKENGVVKIRFHDYGVGITSQNKDLIFGGFFHTQHTDLYSTKRPYEFGAGGAGSDLLRIKCFSEKYGFDVDFETTRCRYIPEDTDLCPGRISECIFVSEVSGCHSSGESIFTINIREEGFQQKSSN